MISVPATSCCACNFCSNASAGGQEEQPSEVNSSTTTGLRTASTEEVCPLAGDAKDEHATIEHTIIMRMRGSGNGAAEYFLMAWPPSLGHLHANTWNDCCRGKLPTLN